MRYFTIRFIQLSARAIDAFLIYECHDAHEEALLCAIPRRVRSPGRLYAKYWSMILYIPAGLVSGYHDAF